MPPRTRRTVIGKCQCSGLPIRTASISCVEKLVKNRRSHSLRIGELSPRVEMLVAKLCKPAGASPAGTLDAASSSKKKPVFLRQRPEPVPEAGDVQVSFAANPRGDLRSRIRCTAAARPWRAMATRKWTPRRRLALHWNGPLPEAGADPDGRTPNGPRSIRVSHNQTRGSSHQSRMGSPAFRGTREQISDPEDHGQPRGTPPERANTRTRDEVDERSPAWGSR